MFKLWETWIPRKGHIYKKYDLRSKRRILSDDNIKFILINSEKLTNEELAVRFNVSKTTIYDVKKHKIYKEIKL